MKPKTKILFTSVLVAVLGVSLLLFRLPQKVEAITEPTCGNGDYCIAPVLKIRLSDPDINNADIEARRDDGSDEYTDFDFDNGAYYGTETLGVTNLIECVRNSANNKINITVKKDGDEIGSGSVNLCDADDNGFVSIQIAVTGDDTTTGTLKVRYNYACPDNGTAKLKPDKGQLTLTGPAGAASTVVERPYNGGTITFSNLLDGVYKLKIVYEDDFSGPSNELANEVTNASDKIGFLDPECIGTYRNKKINIRIRSGRITNLGTITLTDFSQDNTFPDGDPADGTGEAGDNQDNCDAGTGLIDGFLGFVICPLVESVLGMIQWAETNVIIPYLIINPLGTEGDNAVYIMWQALRNIAFVLLVVAFMYLVFAETTALGGEAYQLKRLAPRLVMVTIAISLSYLAIGLVIDFFNVLGLGIAQITAWAMKEVGQQQIVTVETDLGSASLMALIVGTGALALTSALMGGALAAPIIGIAAVTGVFIVLAVVITLILRQVVIMGLVILSPLAFVSLLLPNTEKLFKSWWSIITKALVMYPLIMLLFAAGKIFGSIISAEAGTGPAEEAIRDLLGFMANIAPMALIPFTFKISGGAIGGAWGAMRGGIGKGRKAALGSEHNPRSVLYKGREKSYKNMSERMAGQRSWLPRVPFMRRLPYRGTTLNQHATRALAGAPLIGGWMAGNERIAGARADAEKRIKELAATPIGLERLREEAYGSEAMDAIHPTHRDHDHKPVPGYKREAAKHRANHQRQVMIAKTLGASKEDGGSDERTRHFAKNIAQRVAKKEISAKQGDELWEEYSRAAVSHNPLLLASTQTTGGVRASREAFATDTSLFGATTAGEGAAGTAAAGTAVSIAGTGQATVAEQLLSNEGVVQDLITRAGRSGNTDQLSVHTDKALETIFTPDAAGNLSTVAQNMLASGSNRGKLKQIVLKLEGRNRSSTAAVAADPEAAGYNVTPEQSVVGQAAAKVIRDAIYKVDPNFAPGVTGAPVVPPTRI